jgi:hypothetical protein
VTEGPIAVAYALLCVLATSVIVRDHSREATVIRISKTQLAIVIGTIAACSAACGPVSVLDGHGSTPGSTQQGKILTGDDSAADGGASNSLSEEDGVKIFAPNMSDGSLGGIVMAADTGSPLPSVQVTAVGACAGSGCTDATSASQVADGSGAYVFDAYGDVDGDDDVQDVIAASGQDSLQVTFTTSDGAYTPLVVTFHPTYTTVDSEQYASLPTFYLCPVGAADSDGDGVCDAAETLYGTDSQQPDSDFDALSDPAELFGLDGVDLRYYGASATHADVFVYIDFYQAPVKGSLIDTQAAFDAAPLGNLDGTTGVHLDLLSSGQPIASDAQISNFIISKTNSMGIDYEDWSSFDGIKSPSFPPALVRIAHYALFATQFDSGDWSGYSRGIPAHDFLVTLPGGTRAATAGTFMHELGHNLGLQHGGSESTNYKPNYLSIMSYTYQFDGLFVDGTDGILDYSRVAIAGLDEAVLCETTVENPSCATGGMTPVAPTTADDLSHYGAKFPYLAGQTPGNPVTKVDGTCNGPLDFNNNHQYDKGTVNVDLDGFVRGPQNADPDYQSTVFNSSWNDWINLGYYGDVDGGGWIGDVVTGGLGSVRIVVPPQIVAPSDMPKELRYP